jgi:hypothetical protein
VRRSASFVAAAIGIAGFAGLSGAVSGAETQTETQAETQADSGDEKLLVVPAELRRALPTGAKMILIEKGDLLGDATPEYAVVIEKNDPALRVKNDRLGMPILNTNPRVLILLTRKGKAYQPVATFPDFLPAEGDAENSCLADPLLSEGGIEIARKHLKISLGYWLSCGSYGVTRHTYVFRAAKERMQLIGFDRLSFSRASGLGDETSINFLTGKRKTTTNVTVIGPDDGETPEKPKVKWSKIGVKPLYLDMMDKAVCADYETAPIWCGNT